MTGPDAFKTGEENIDISQCINRQIQLDGHATAMHVRLNMKRKLPETGQKNI